MREIESATSTLEQLLREECELVALRPDPEALHDLAERKTRISEELNRLEKQRLNLGNINPNADTRLPDAILESLGRCQQLNLRVGAHISAQSRYTGRALDILGQGGEGSLYTPAGTQAATSKGHALGKA